MNPQDTTTNTQPVVPVSQTPLKIGRFTASRMIFNQSWQILKQDKELAWFPVLSAISGLIVLIIFGAVMFFTSLNGDFDSLSKIDTKNMQALSYILLFAYYVTMFFVTNYFLAGIYTIVHSRFNNQNLSFSDGITNANKNISKIFVWSIISATVGLILNIIAEKSEIIGKIVAYMFGAAWNILTYFSLPSLIVGQKSIKESFKESAVVIRKTWGETIIINFGVGLFFGFIFIVTTIIFAGVVVLVPVTGVFILMAILYVLFVVSMIIISSTLGSIFKLALYEYAITGKIPEGFTSEVIQGAIVSGK